VIVQLSAKALLLLRFYVHLCQVNFDKLDLNVALLELMFQAKELHYDFDMGPSSI
jgi:hypothetical protein